MKTIELGSTNQQVVELLDQAGSDDLLLRLADGREFLLTAIDDFDVEVSASRRNEKLMAFLDTRGAASTTIPLDEVKKRLGL